eukprot:SAG11_NODE_631_length_8061_cov_13.466843_1_plen_1055_part_00
MPARLGGESDFNKYIVENHHLSMYKSVLSASAHVDNRAPESKYYLPRGSKQWKLRKQFEKKKNAGDAVWNLNTDYMEKLLAEEGKGAGIPFLKYPWNIAKELQQALRHHDTPVEKAVKMFQTGEGGLDCGDLISMLAGFRVQASEKQVNELFDVVACGQSDFITAVDLELAFSKVHTEGYVGEQPPGEDQENLLAKTLSQRIGRLREVFDLFDPDGRGTITVSEFARGMRALHIHATDLEIRQLAEEADESGSGVIDYAELISFLKKHKRMRDKKRQDELESRLLNFCQEDKPCSQKVTPRHWKQLWEDEVRKRLSDNVELVARKLREKDAHVQQRLRIMAEKKFGPKQWKKMKETQRQCLVIDDGSEHEEDGFVTAVQMHRVLLEHLGMKVSGDHFTHFIQNLPRKTVEFYKDNPWKLKPGQTLSLVHYHPFLDFFRREADIAHKKRQDEQRKSDRHRRKVENDQQHKQTLVMRHTAVATAVLEAINNAGWGSSLASEIRKARLKANTLYQEDDAAKEGFKTFQDWLKGPGKKKNRRRKLAKEAWDMAEQLEFQSKTTGIDALKMAFKVADRDSKGTLGATGFVSVEKFKDVIRGVTGKRMQGWNDFEGAANISPRQLEFCVDIAEKVSQNITASWQYKDNRGVWKDYDPETSQELAEKKELFQEQAVRRSFKQIIRGREYKIDFDRMIQEHIKEGETEGNRTGRKRDIQIHSRLNEEVVKKKMLIKYDSFVRRLIKAEAFARYKAYNRQGGGRKNRPDLLEMEAETRRLLAGVTDEMQMALHLTLSKSPLKTIFAQWDTDGDGKLTKAEMREGLNSLQIKIDGKTITDEQIEKLIEVLDQDDDGCLSYKEFADQFAKEPRKKSARDVVIDSLSPKVREEIRKNKTNLRKIFHAFDLDGDGAISAAELRLGIKSLGIDLNSKDIAELVKVMDQNNDGSIDWNEFQAVFGDGAMQRGVSRSYQRAQEHRQRIAELHPEIIGMRNKANAAVRVSNVSPVQFTALPKGATERQILSRWFVQLQEPKKNRPKGSGAAIRHKVRPVVCHPINQFMSGH